jgi:broad specificity phosphatase PhoE
MRLILVRHGQTPHNADGLVQGRADIPLSELGRQQAAAIAAALAGEAIAAIVSSPLRRARDTAALIAATRGLTVSEEPDLIEMNVGVMEGLSGAEMRSRYPHVLQRWLEPGGTAVPLPGGESLAAVQERAWRAVTRLHQRYPTDTVVVVTHNFVIVSLVCQVIGLPLDGFRRFRIDVASRTTLEVGPEHCRLLHLNDTCHLRGLSPSDAPSG